MRTDAQGLGNEPLRVFAVEAGDARSPVILHVPHAARALPADAGLLVDGPELAEELDHLTDAHTDVIARRAAALSPVKPWVFVNLFSRMVVDPERFPDEREEMLSAGMGAVYTRGYAGRPLRSQDSVRDKRLLNTYFHPYAAGMSALVAGRLAVTGRAVLIDVHSYATVALPYELHGAGPRPPICLGTDEFHTPPELLAAARDAFPGHGLNTPFAGCYVPLERYGTDSSVSALMIEIRRDGYMIEPGGPLRPAVRGPAVRGPAGRGAAGRDSRRTQEAGVDVLAQALSRLVTAASGMKI